MSLESGKIKVVCHGCGARYQVSSAKVHGRKFRATCKRCGGIIVARCGGASVVIPEEDHQTEEAIHLADKRDAYQEEASWYVVIGGKPHGPLTKVQVRQSFNSRQINERTYMWKTGDPEWRRLGEVPDFAALMGEESASHHQAEEDEPTLNPDQGGVVGEIVDGVRQVGAGPEPAQAPETTGETRIRFSPEDHLEDEDGEPTFFRHPGYQQPSEKPDNLASTGQGEPALTHEMEKAAPTDSGYPDPDRAHEAWAAPQHEAWPLPGSSRRKATLPAPTGEPRHLSRDLPPLDRPSPSPSPSPAPLPSRSLPAVDEPKEPSEPVGSLSELVPEDAKAAPPVGPEISPAPLFSTPGLPPPPVSGTADKEGFAGSLSPQTAPSDLLIAVKESFWTLGKIIGAAAIGGGLVVAMAVVIGVMVTRSGMEAQGPQASIKKAQHLTGAPRGKAETIAPSPAKLARVETAAMQGTPGGAAGQGAPGGAAGQGTPGGAAGQGTPGGAAGQVTPGGTAEQVTPGGTAEQGTPGGAAGQGTPGGAAGKVTPGGTAEQGTPGRAAGQGTPGGTAEQGTPGRAAGQGTPGGTAGKGSKVPRAPSATSLADRKTISVKKGSSDQHVKHRPESKSRAQSTARSRSGSRTRSKQSTVANVDDLLSVATESRSTRASTSSAGADEDDILQAGAKSRRRSSRAASNVDDLLQAGARRRRSSSSSSPSEARAGSALPTSLTKEQVQRTMAKVMPQIRSCMAKFNPGSGLLKVKMTISGDGVPKAQVVGSFSGTPVSYCVLDGIFKLRFPPFSGPAVSFTYPFKL